MEPIDAIARISHLLLSRRISANLVLGVLVAAAIVFLAFVRWPSWVAALLRLGATPATFVLLLFVIFGYGVANLLNSAIIGTGRWLVARRRIAEQMRWADEEKEAKRERQEGLRRQRIERLCKLISHVTEEDRKLLRLLNDEAPDHEVAFNSYHFRNEYTHLLTQGFISVVETDLPDSQELYRLTPEAIDAIEAYRRAWAEQHSEGDSSPADVET